MNLIFVFLVSFLGAGAAADDPFEKTFPRANAVCYVNKQRLEVYIRGESLETEPSENGTGKYLFYRKGDLLPEALATNGFDTFSFFPGKSGLCSKTPGFLLEKDLFVLLLRKEGNIVIQPFALPEFKPGPLIATEHGSEKAYQKGAGVVFLTHIQSRDRIIGKVTIAGASYTYQDRDFPLWIQYSKRGFETLTTHTFRNFPWRRFFKDEKEFLAAAGWDPGTKKFTRAYVYLAVNPSAAKKCLLLVKEKEAIDGKEPWRCQ